jgi:NAD(P)-dependent dehydrogenase (short-subunit alcohol dehydrogenase family)
VAKHIVITGASTGIGRAAAEDLVARGYHVFGSVRKEADAATLKAAMGERFTPLLFDVADEAAIGEAARQVEQQLKGEGLGGLINNAGIAVPGPLMHLPLADFRRQLEINVTGVLAVTQAFLPLLGARKDAPQPAGRIVNISSVSGKIVYPFLVPYSISKHALEAMSDGLRRELLIYGIDVIVIEPGSVKTPIWEKAAEEETSHFAHTDYAEILKRMQATFVDQGRRGMLVEVVTKAIREALEAERPKTRYALPRKWLSGWLIPRLLPDRWLDRIMAGRLGIKR